MITSAIKILKAFVLKHKILFIMICAIQVIALLASLYVYSFLISQKEDDKNTEGYRIFRITYKEPPNNQVISQQIEDFMNSCDEPLQQVYITDEEQFIDFDYVFRTENKPVARGRYFTETEFKNNKHKAIVEEDGIFGNPILGDQITVKGELYTVIGLTGGNTILPFSAFSDVPHENSKITICFENYLSDASFEKISESLIAVFENTDVDLPGRITDSGMFDISVIGYLGLFLIALLNVAFAYKYMLAQNQTVIYTFRTNGASKMQCITVFLIAIFAFAVLSLVFGAVLSRVLLPSLLEFTKMETLGYFLKPIDYIKLIILFLGVIAVVFIPFVSKTVNNISISDRTERD